MTTRIITSSAWVVAVGVLLLALPSFADRQPKAAKSNEAVDKSDQKPTAAGDLVQKALQAALAGQKDRRDALVKQALQASPDFAPAHWLKGEVKFEGQWRTLAEAQRIAAADPRLADYHRVRDQTPNTAQGQLTLAKWCQVNGLTEEARAHFTNLFELQPGNPEAVKALGLKLYNGQWLTQEQITAQALNASELEKATKGWKPVMAGWRKTIEHGSPAERDDALQQLRSLTDPKAIPALEAVLSRAGNRLGLEVIAILDAMPDQAATEALVRHAVLGRSEKVRNAAADALKKRPKYLYIPLLLSELKAPVKTDLEVTSDGANLKYRNTLSQQGQERDQTKVVEAYLGLTTPNPAYSFFLNNALAQAMLQAEQDEKTAAAENKKALPINERIYAVLARITGEELYPEPRSWWDWWQKYNESYVSERPQYEQYYRYEYGVPYFVQDPYRYGLGTVPPISSISHSSCFAKGTPAWTLAGRRPIEELKVGDRILSQNPETGELAYKSILKTTLLPPVPMLSISLGPERIVATKGHPFWVVGQGWEMAKEVAVGSRLHCLSGESHVDHVAQAPNGAAYNLVVEDFNNYFVGNAGLLVHDFTGPKPTIAILPGLLRTVRDATVNSTATAESK